MSGPPKGTPEYDLWIQRLKESHKGINLGKKHSEETKRKIGKGNSKMTEAKWYSVLNAAAARKGKEPWNKGKPRTPEEKAAISKAKKGKPVIKSPLHVKKIALALTGKPVGPRTLGYRHTEENKKLMSAIKQGIPIEEFTGFKRNDDYCEKFNNPFKERVREHFGRVCVQCGKSEKECKRKLSVHHVNYRKDACCDPDVKLLFVQLCINCHAKTHHKREAWEGHFTKIINEKYGGKCYLPKQTPNLEDIGYSPDALSPI